jgi:hypothetical protein
VQVTPQASGSSGGHTQVPPLQILPAVHAWPQEPQLLASVRRFVHRVVQSSGHALPEKHPQAPSRHCSFGRVQAVLQPPQCAGSVCVFAQKVPQSYKSSQPTRGEITVPDTPGAYPALYSISLSGEQVFRSGIDGPYDLLVYLSDPGTLATLTTDTLCS